MMSSFSPFRIPSGVVVVSAAYFPLFSVRPFRAAFVSHLLCRRNFVVCDSVKVVNLPGHKTAVYDHIWVNTFLVH